MRKSGAYLTRPHYFEPLHAKGVSEITFPDFAACIRTIESTRSSITANCARNVLYSFFSWVLSEGLMGGSPVNPVIGTRTPPGSIPRDRVLSDDELIAFWRTTADDAAAGGQWRDSLLGRHRDIQRDRYLNNWRNFCRVLRLLLLLGARHNEIAGMPWSELDLAAGTWTLPKERSKNKRPLTLTLPKAALDILAAQPRRPGDVYVFGPRRRAIAQYWAHGRTQTPARRPGGPLDRARPKAHRSHPHGRYWRHAACHRNRAQSL
jgi:integrase